MGCCGEGRSRLSAARAGKEAEPRRARSVPEAPRSIDRPAAGAPSVAWKGRRSAAPETPDATLRLRYLQRSPILVPGGSTGRRYAFSATEPVQVVDRRDADAILRTGFFERVP